MSSSSEVKMFFRCLEIAGCPTPKRFAICACVSHTVLFQSLPICSKMEHVLFASNSFDEYMLLICFVIAGRFVPKSSAICACVSHIVSFSKRTSRLMVSLGRREKGPAICRDARLVRPHWE